MKVLLTGADGQLGRELSRAKPQGVELAALDRRALDITDHEAVAEVVAREAPAVLLNAAAYTAVDRAESDEAAAFAVNAEAVGRLGACAAEHGTRLIHLSTDFVFDGRAGAPYRPSDPTGPASAYGRSKLAGEEQALAASPRVTIVRTAWLYSALGRNFVTTMLGLMRERRELRVVSDQVGSPTWAALLARTLWKFVEREDLAGIWHWSDAGRCSWFDFAGAIQEEAAARDLLEVRIPIRPVTSAEFAARAPRPAMSALDSTATCAALGIETVAWRVALGRMLDEMKAQENG